MLVIKCMCLQFLEKHMYKLTLFVMRMRLLWLRDYCWASVHVINGHYIYKAIWIGKILQCKQETGNPEDLYAVSIMNGDTYCMARP